VPDDSDFEAISRMLGNPREETAILIERERVICGPGSVREALTRIDEALATFASGGSPCRVALLSDDPDECSMIAAAVVERAIALSLSALSTHRDWGRWARAAREMANNLRMTHVLIGVPPVEKAREGFAAIAGGLILLWPVAMAGTASLPEGIEEIILPPLAERPLDKAAQLIATAVDALDAAEEFEGEKAPAALLARMDPAVLLAVCIDRPKLASVSAARDAGKRLAEELLRHAALQPNDPVTAANLHRALFPQPDRLPPNQRRLWVEGETDVSLFRLAARLLNEATGNASGLLDNIHLEPLGGAAQVESALHRCDRDPKLELFLFDADFDGKRGAAKVEKLGFPQTLLDPKAVAAACDAEWVVEDLLSVACLDRFYCAHPLLKPAREEIAHHPITGRRLVVHGEDKETLVRWLEAGATIEDLCGVVRQLLIVRRIFALREVSVECDPPADARSGLRPQPWWFVRGADGTQ
jgi:hypothetical protein